VDTFDTLAGVRHVIDLARELGDDFRVHAVRLDSGDLAALALDSRVLLDEAGLHEVQIVVSGGLDEDRIAELRSADAPIDGYAVGTRVNVSQDAPSLETAYKLVEYAGVGRQKLSFDKVTLPHRKQVFRRFESGIAVGDTIGTADEDLPGTSLLALVMQQGERISPGRVSLAEAREFTRGQIGQLPPYLKQIELGTSHYPVSLSSRLRANLDASA
ncbi:MAG: nicotinate phosphoribosyltransferase, partial [Dehalococcoidia bacterium]